MQTIKPLWKAIWTFLITLKTHFPYEYAIECLDIYSHKVNNYVHMNIYTLIMEAALFIITRKCEKQKCSSTGELKKYVVYLYIGILFNDKIQTINAHKSRNESQMHYTK